MKKKKQKYEEVNYWETMADSLIALLLCILLIALLLILYLVRMPEEKLDDELGNTTEQLVASSEGFSESAVDNDPSNGIDNNPNNSYGGGGGYGGGGYGGGGNYGGDGDGTGQEQGQYPQPGTAEGRGKAAVYVEIVDGETGRTIKQENVEFELYDRNNQLQVLSTYYPEKIDFKKYSTDEAGTFYLPEKVKIQDYYLRALTRVPGYDFAEDTALEINEGYEWNEPYTAKVIMYPEKNIIRIRLRDKDTSKTVTGATFDIVAAEDVTTKDGTIRYKNGDVVDTVTLDAYGYGESKELYLGEYLIQQAEVPQYYAKILEDTRLILESKAKDSDAKVQELRAEKTAARVELTDELYTNTYLSGAQFVLTNDAGEVVSEGATKDNGRITFTNLSKDTTYHLQQLTTNDGYDIPNVEYDFTVDVEGLVDGSAQHRIEARNRMIRVSVGVRDKIFRGQVSDVNIGIRDASGNIIKSWNSTAIEQTLEALVPGEYMVIIAGNEKKANRITVKDTAEIQAFQFSIWTTTDIGTLLGLALFLLALLILIIVLLVLRARRKAEEEEEKAQADVDIEAQE